MTKAVSKRARQLGSEAARALGKLAVASMTAEELSAQRSAAARAMWAKPGQKKKFKKRQPAMAKKGGESISPEAAKARALKAWETKRRKQANDK
jgi:hypothetical protein